MHQGAGGSIFHSVEFLLSIRQCSLCIVQASSKPNAKKPLLPSHPYYFNENFKVSTIKGEAFKFVLSVCYMQKPPCLWTWEAHKSKALMDVADMWVTLNTELLTWSSASWRSPLCRFRSSTNQPFLIHLASWAWSPLQTQKQSSLMLLASLARQRSSPKSSVKNRQTSTRIQS